MQTFALYAVEGGTELFIACWIHTSELGMEVGFVPKEQWSG